MRWAGWSWQEYYDAPEFLTDTLQALALETIKAEQEAVANRAGRESSEPLSDARPGVAAMNTETTTGSAYEWEKTVTPDGKVEKRRKLEEGEKVLHGIFGAPPKRLS